MSRILFDRALEAAKAYHAAMPALPEFQHWPDDITWAGRAARAVPAVALLQADSGTRAQDGPGAEETRALHLAVVALAPFAEWRLTYTEAEVGADFLNRFGWFELIGPEGHFHSLQTRMTVGYWGAGLHYPRHEHEPEELYAVLSGAALFEADGEEARLLQPGQTRLHRSLQSHALTTQDQPILTFVLWRGQGLAIDPRMSAT